LTGFDLRQWQRSALDGWNAAGHRGIVEVVTGGGKTVFALACIESLKPDTSLIVVPTIALLDQWWEEVASYFGLALDEVNVVTGQRAMRTGTINLAVLNTAAKLQASGRARPCLLVVDECHKAASPQFRAALDIPKLAALGLSATPERPYDDGLSEILVPSLGSMIYEYTYKDALRDGVVVPFKLQNIVFELEPERQQEYDRLTKAIARAIRKNGIEATETVGLLLRRARVLNLSINRVKLALQIIAANRGRRILVFHEDIEACDLINHILLDNNVKSGVYHSKLGLRQRAQILSSYRRGDIEVLVTCRALDEGFNVPEAQVGIIAASTATRRQRIQRLGRVLRPSSNKNDAVVFSLVATAPEITRLKEEEGNLEGVAEVGWSRA
jgi:superfamily II DNA or RNA helicase